MSTWPGAMTMRQIRAALDQAALAVADRPDGGSELDELLKLVRELGARLQSRRAGGSGQRSHAPRRRAGRQR